MTTRRALVLRLAAVAGALAAHTLGRSGGEPAAAPPADAALASATFAGGCFWCMEPPFEALDGVVSVESGYTGGTQEAPTYEEVSAGGTGHYEAVRVRYDPGQVSYGALVRHFFRTVDPTDAGGQFCDRGSSYRTAIFVRTPAERRAAEAEQARAAKALGRPIRTKILAAGTFWPAEAYHQDYYRKNPVRYRYYRYRCGRDARLREIWGDNR